MEATELKTVGYLVTLAVDGRIDSSSNYQQEMAARRDSLFGGETACDSNSTYFVQSALLTGEQAIFIQEWSDPENGAGNIACVVEIFEGQMVQLDTANRGTRWYVEGEPIGEPSEEKRSVVRMSSGIHSLNFYNTSFSDKTRAWVRSHGGRIVEDDGNFTVFLPETLFAEGIFYLGGYKFHRGNCNLYGFDVPGEEPVVIEYTIEAGDNTVYLLTGDRARRSLDKMKAYWDKK